MTTQFNSAFTAQCEAMKVRYRQQLRSAPYVAAVPQTAQLLKAGYVPVCARPLFVPLHTVRQVREGALTVCQGGAAHPCTRVPVSHVYGPQCTRSIRHQGARIPTIGDVLTRLHTTIELPVEKKQNPTGTASTTSSTERGPVCAEASILVHDLHIALSQADLLQGYNVSTTGVPVF